MNPVSAGQALNLSASFWNEIIAAVNYVKTLRAMGRSAGVPGEIFCQEILVKNSSGADRDQFEILGIDDSDLAAADPQFFHRVVLNGVTPDESNHAGKFVVLMEPILSEKYGRAFIAGVCVAPIDVQDEEDEFADVAYGDCTKLKSGLSGSAHILWKESGTGSKWAVVRLGNKPPECKSDNPKELSGSGETADTESWDIEDDADDYDGVKFTPFRLYWSGTSGDPVYQFTRQAQYDSMGKLISVSAEQRSTAFDTGDCEA